MSGAKVFVGLSGGVDSAVSAALLQQEGYDVTGVFIRIVVPGYPCTAGADRVDAMRVAAHLRIPFVEVDFSKEYEQEVFAPSIEGFAHGETPNPDVLCNRQIKFGAFYDFCRARGADFVATGHYARLAKPTDSGYGDFVATKSPEVASSSLGKPPPSVVLLGGLDSDKDQTYFLWAVPQEVLSKTLFPVGDKTKTEVRALAKKFGLPNAQRPDSQGLCFLGPISMEDMLERELELQPGEVLSESGEVIGRHEGAARYTLGQRHGFELAVHAAAAPPFDDARRKPHYVVGKDVEKNTITVSTSRFPLRLPSTSLGTGRSGQAATKTEITLRDANWIGEVPDGPCEARFRYRQKLIPAELKHEGHQMSVMLLEPHYVPRGQSLVLYRGTRCLGGGVIENALLKS